MFDDYLLGDYATLAMVWGEDDLLIINGNVSSFAPIPTVPVPATVWLFASGVAMLGGIRRRLSGNTLPL